VLDVRLPSLSGLDLQRELIAHGVSLPIIFITGHGDIPMSVRAMKAGALEFLSPSRFATRTFWTRSRKPSSATALHCNSGWKSLSYASGLML
jgi:ActR/RegA family two-component response regulator